MLIVANPNKTCDSRHARMIFYHSNKSFATAKRMFREASVSNLMYHDTHTSFFFFTKNNTSLETFWAFLLCFGGILNRRAYQILNYQSHSVTSKFR